MAWPKGKPRAGMKYAGSKRTEKTCPKCQVTKPRTPEYFAFNCRGYPQSRCKACQCPSGIPRSRGIGIEKKKKKRPLHQKIQLHVVAEIKPKGTYSVCACCKGAFKSSGNNSYGVYCSRDCQNIYSSQASYMKFLGLVDFC